MSTSLLEDLLKHAPQDSRGKVPEYQEESFKYQLECLKLEIDLVERTLSRIETITQTVKNFAVVSWAGAVTIFLGQNDLRRFVLVTALLPVIFWLLDGWWVHMNRGASVRLRKITEFLNSDYLAESFKRKRLIEFTVLDVLGRQYRGTKEYERYTSFRRVLRFREMVILYGSLLVLSLILGVIALRIF